MDRDEALNEVCLVAEALTAKRQDDLAERLYEAVKVLDTTPVGAPAVDTASGAILHTDGSVEYLPSVPAPAAANVTTAVSYKCGICRDTGWISDTGGDRACWHGKPAPAAGARHDSDDMWQRIKGTLNGYRCQHTVDEDADGLALVDVLSPGPSVKEGQEEIELLTDEIWRALQPQAAATPGGCGAQVHSGLLPPSHRIVRGVS